MLLSAGRGRSRCSIVTTSTSSSGSKKLPLVQLLKATGWRETFTEKDYVILER